MAKIEGRKVRWSLSTDSGSTYTALGGSTSDGVTFNFEGIDATDKDDGGNRTYLDAIGVQSLSGTVTMYIEDVALWTAYLSSPTTHLLDLKIDVDGLFEITGQFIMTSIAVSGNEGAEAATQEVSFESSGALTFTAD